jgi:hypothetical protein
MNYQKIDAVLAAALDEIKNPEEPALSVFIQTAQTPGSSVTAFLKDLGVHGISPGRQLFTATLSPRAVSVLSEQPWVRSLKLSRKLRMLDENVK